jgi:hypothetical protein
MKPTRRELATAVVAAALARNVEAKAAQNTTSPNIARLVHDANQRNSDTLAKFELPIATEPAFRFEA